MEEIEVLPSFAGTVNLEWERPEGSLIGYSLQYEVTDGTIASETGVQTRTINDTSSTISFSIEGLEPVDPDTPITVNVTVTTLAGPSDDPFESEPTVQEIGKAQKHLKSFIPKRVISVLVNRPYAYDVTEGRPRAMEGKRGTATCAPVRWGANEALPRAPSPSMQPAGQPLHAIPPAGLARAHALTESKSANALFQHNTCAQS